MPPRKYKTITVSAEIYNILKEMARRRNISLNDMLKEILEEYEKGKRYVEYE